jgi:hypothetical protein
MPNIQSLSELDALRHRLRQELDVGHAVHSVEWGNPRVMTESLKRIRRELGGGDQDRPTEDKLQAALARFAASGAVLSFTELKYLCYGATVPVGEEHWRLIDRQKLFDSLLNLVNHRAQQSKKFRRCYQGLLSGYFGFERNLDDPGEAERRWVTLREFLAEQLTPLRKACADKGQTPDWLTILYEHQNLLTSDPCSRYAKALERGDEAELHEVCAGLGISSNSWVWIEAMMAYVKQVCQGSDKAFKERMPSVLDLVNGKTAVTLPPALAVMATAMMVTRYEQCVEHPEHAGLRDTCVQWIGNPWVKRVAWDAAVNHEPARLMVNSWLKQRLIRDFFELLAADGSADIRRLNYWLKWEPQITDMWFVLGGEAAFNKTAEFQEVRKRMSGQDRRLHDSNPKNNAFVMRIGPLLVIEFGVTGNACYIFAASDFKANLEKRFLTVHELKQKVGVACRPLSHAGSNWEGRFDFEIRQLLQRIPASRGVLVATHEIVSNTQPRPAPLHGVRAHTVAPFPPSQPPRAWPFSQPDPDKDVVSESVTRHEPEPPSPVDVDDTPADTAAPSATTQPARVWPFARSDTGKEVVSDSVSRDEPESSSSELAEARRVAAILVGAPRREASAANRPRPLSRGRLSDMEFAQLQRLLKETGVEWEDNRPKGGALWVLIPDEHQQPRVTAVLQLYGFRFTAGRGYWLKGD